LPKEGAKKENKKQNYFTANTRRREWKTKITLSQKDRGKWAAKKGVEGGGQWIGN